MESMTKFTKKILKKILICWSSEHNFLATWWPSMVAKQIPLISSVLKNLFVITLPPQSNAIEMYETFDKVLFTHGLLPNCSAAKASISSLDPLIFT